MMVVVVVHLPRLLRTARLLCAARLLHARGQLVLGQAIGAAVGDLVVKLAGLIGGDIVGLAGNEFVAADLAVAIGVELGEHLGRAGRAAAIGIAVGIGLGGSAGIAGLGLDQHRLHGAAHLLESTQQVALGQGPAFAAVQGIEQLAGLIRADAARLSGNKFSLIYSAAAICIKL